MKGALCSFMPRTPICVPLDFIKEILDKEKIVQEEAVRATVTAEQDVEAAISQASCHADVYSKVKVVVGLR